VIDLHTRPLAAVIPAGSGADIFTELRTGPSAGQAITTARYGGFLDVVTPSPPALLSMISTAPSVPVNSTETYPGMTGPEGVGSHMVVIKPAGTRAYASDRPGGAVTVLDLSGGHSRIPAQHLHQLRPVRAPRRIGVRHVHRRSRGHHLHRLSGPASVTAGGLADSARCIRVV